MPSVTDVLFQRTGPPPASAGGRSSLQQARARCRLPGHQVARRLRAPASAAHAMKRGVRFACHVVVLLVLQHRNARGQQTLS